MYFPVDNFTIPPNINVSLEKKIDLFQWEKIRCTVDIAGFQLHYSSATISLSSLSLIFS